MRFAVIANPHARAFRDDEGGLEPLYELASGRGLVLTPDTLEELTSELENVRDMNPEFVAVAGGDGTVSRFTTAALAVWGPDALPPIAILHGGTMNTISKSLGNRGTAEAQLASVLAGTTTRTRRWPLQVGEHRYGWLFGTGVVPRYIQVYEATGNQSPRQAATTLASLAAQAFFGGASDVFVRERIDVYVDGRPLPLKDWLVVAAAGIDDMGLRFRPFTGVLDAPGKLGIYATSSRPYRFVLDLLPFRLGREARHSLSFQALGQELRLVAPEPILFNLDGDVEVGPTTLTVRSGPPVTFLLPAGGKPPRNTLGP